MEPVYAGKPTLRERIVPQAKPQPSSTLDDT